MDLMAVRWLRYVHSTSVALSSVQGSAFVSQCAKTTAVFGSFARGPLPVTDRVWP
jgi:hypothetical protein